MPLIKANGRVMQDGTKMIQYTDTVGPSYVTYTLENEQESMVIINRGLKSITFSVGATTATLDPGQKQKVETTFTSFQVKSSEGIQQFEVRMDEVGTVGVVGGTDPGLSQKVSELSSQLAQKAQQIDVAEMSTVLNTKVDKNGNEQVSMAMLQQEVKEAMTGGSVAVVGENSVNTSNLVDGATTFKKMSADFQNDYLNKTGLLIKNKISNYDFINGATGWNYLGGTINVSNRVATVTGNGTYTFVRLSQVSGMVAGDKYFIKTKAKVMDSECTKLQITWFDGTKTHVIAEVSSPVAGKDYLLSGEFIGETTNANAQVILVANYVNAAATSTKQLITEYISVIDLYETYGKDKEPVSKTLFDKSIEANNNTLSDAIKNDFGLNVKNKINNGDFSAGIINWNYTNSTISAANNVLKLTGDGTNKRSTLRQIVAGAYNEGRRLYYKVRARVTNDQCQKIEITPSSNFGGSWGTTIINNPVKDKWYELTNVYTLLPPSQPNNTLQFPIFHEYADSITANGKIMEVQYVVVLDLTEIFGAGKEPPLSEMNAIMDTHKNRFIDERGKPLVNFGSVYKNTIDQTKLRPTGTYSVMLEHEWRTGESGHWVTPKMFVVDSKKDIYSTMDYGKTWEFETNISTGANFQVSNVNKRLVIKAPSATSARDAVVRVYTSDYQLISEKKGTHGVYGTDSLDGKPNDDSVFIFAEYLDGGDPVNGVNLYRTEDSGATWQSVLHLTDVVHIHSVRFDPFNPEHVYATTGDAGEQMRNRWYKSTDSGKTWQLIAGGTLNGGQTPMINGTFDHDKYMRTTTTAMGVDTGPKGRNSIFFFHDNNPMSFLRFDKTTHKFQHITGDLHGVAYGTTITKDGMFTIVEQPGVEYDILYFVKFPVNDDDIDKPEKYETFTCKLPRSGHYMRQRWSRQQDVAGGILVAANSGHLGRSLIGERNGLAMKVNIGWQSQQRETAKLEITGAVTSSGGASSQVTITLNGNTTYVRVEIGDTAAQVAGKIRVTNIEGIVVGGEGNVVTFTSTIKGEKLTGYYSQWGTGANGVLYDADNTMIVGLEPIMTIP